MADNASSNNDIILTGDLQLFKLNHSNVRENLLASHQLDLKLDLIQSLTEYEKVESILQKKTKPTTDPADGPCRQQGPGLHFMV